MFESCRAHLLETLDEPLVNRARELGHLSA